jgi:hypothetical protein
MYPTSYLIRAHAGYSLCFGLIDTVIVISPE